MQLRQLVLSRDTVKRAPGRTCHHCKAQHCECVSRDLDERPVEPEPRLGKFVRDDNPQLPRPSVEGWCSGPAISRGREPDRHIPNPVKDHNRVSVLVTPRTLHFCHLRRKKLGGYRVEHGFTLWSKGCHEEAK